MNTLPFMRHVLPLLLGVVAVGAASADDPRHTDEAQLRAAVTKGLTFLAKEGDTWMNEKTCNACHTMPLLLWSHREARQRGIPIDNKMFAEFVEWSEERANKDTKGAAEVGAFLKLAMPDKPAPEITSIVAGLQQADGSWKPGGQFASMQRREASEAAGNTMRLALLALAAKDGDPSVAEAARTKASAVLEKSGPAKSVETLVFRTLYARRFGQPEEVAALRTEILKLQHADGGWGWMIDEEHSDSLATGEVLYLLQQAAADASAAEAIARGQRWLLDQQRDDGGWSIDITRISKIDRSAPDKSNSFKAATGIYTFWGSAWATIGLLEGLPVVEKPAGPATP